MLFGVRHSDCLGLLLPQNAGECKLEDFGVELFTRNVQSEQQCSASAPGLDSARPHTEPLSHKPRLTICFFVTDPLCIGIPATRDDSRVLSHADAAAIASEVPDKNDPAPGSRGLPLPRSVVEAMSMLAYARQRGVYGFWAASPNTENGDVVMHWLAEGGSNLVVRKGENRCILVSSGVGPAERMYARLRQCDAKLASGILSVAAAAVRLTRVTRTPRSHAYTLYIQAPPPPPGATLQHWYDPARAPPPPPSIKRAALEIYVRNEVRPRVEAICAGGLEGQEHQTVCIAVANRLSLWQPIHGAGIVAPFCERICWHSCVGEAHAGGQDDGFRECPSEGCAHDSCLEFLLR